MKTPVEAKDHVCHKSMNSDFDFRQLCIASDCMAWRWVPKFEPAPPPAQMMYRVPSTHGYCGLVGKPEDAQTP